MRDLTGEKFTRWTVLSIDPSNNDKYVCECECGTIRSVNKYSLTRKNGSKSCGCLQKERQLESATKHGMHGTPTYSSWKSMKDRCLWTGHPDYTKYSKLGICDEWLEFEQFYIDMGDRPEGTSLDRIDNSKGYSPTNCRWATYSEQIINQDHKGTTVEKHIRVTKSGSYEVSFFRHSVNHYVGKFSTIDEAIKARDEWLENN